ncbi:furin-like protein [Dermatophagoides farinae]|uniref:furin n=1 Tax=Dermatophagoides farinae TaxID=6954 RepID=A0A9D4P508_DERFA|nr:furin-like protease kpc-1 [Dermatophagoides farinae]KAH7643737.1 furin-like protein [Dermatophagoides farinae]
MFNKFISCQNNNSHYYDLHNTNRQYGFYRKNFSPPSSSSSSSNTKYLISIWSTIILSLIFITTITTTVQAIRDQHHHYTNEFALALNNCYDHIVDNDVYQQKYHDNIAQQLADRYGFINHGKVGTLNCHYLFSHNHVSKRSADYSHQHHRLLANDEQVHWVEQQRIYTRQKRDNQKSNYRYRRTMPDPIFRDMWYLNKGARGGFDMNVQNAWKIGYTGKGVVVTILDDGIQPNHPELVKNYDPHASYDINDNDPDPTPADNGDNKHGTRCAGEVAAEAYNDFCGVGIAFNASIGGVRMLDGIVTDQVEARAIGHNPQYIDIYSASWGPEDDGKTVDGPGKLAKRAFVDGIRKGRRGRGSIYVWASGNGGRRLDNCNCDGYTNSIYTLSISSATQNGNKPWYLEECSSTLSTTYSSGTPNKDGNILTCDQDTSYFKALKKGEIPEKDSLCTRTHTGTSASAPIAAAIIALALEANPNLTWRDMQHLVVMSSRYEPLRHEKGWTTNGVGRKFSHKFGYGLLDAESIVRYAEKWTTVPSARICETATQIKEWEIPAQHRKQLEVSLLTSGCRGTSNYIRYLEHVQAKITLKYQPRGNLKISLISPSGTISHLLFPRPRDMEDISFNSWPFLSVHFWGEPPDGTWRLVIQNDGSKSSIVPGKLYSWSLVFYGTFEKTYAQRFYNETIRYYPRSTSPATAKLNDCVPQGLYKMYESDECVKKCPPKQWTNNDIGQCIPCNNACDSCFGPSSDNCLSCTNGYFFDYHCLDRCPDGYYEDIELKECLPCSTNCLTCSQSPDICITCKSSDYKLNEKNRCLLDEEYSISSNQLLCHDSCEKCNGSSSNDCLTCKDGLKFFKGSCIDFDCPEGYYNKQKERSISCESCHYSCETCNGPSHFECKSCFKNSTLVNGTCYLCLEGHFMNQMKKCELCHSSCSTCSGPLASDCITCKSGLFMDNMRCVPCCQNMLNEFTECCRCVNPDGPCASIDVPRSIQTINDKPDRNIISIHQLFGFVFSHFSIYILLIILFSIIVLMILQRQVKSFGLMNRKRSESFYHVNYQKLNFNKSSRRRNIERSLDEDYGDVDDDDEEHTLFQKV